MMLALEMFRVAAAHRGRQGDRRPDARPAVRVRRAAAAGHHRPAARSTGPGWARLRTRLSGHLRLRPRRAVGQDQPLLLRGRLAAVRARPRGRRRADRRLRGPAGRHPRRPRPGAHLRRPRRRAVRELRRRRAPTAAARITVGHLAPGLQTGFCKDTGGGWGQQLVAHRSQMHVGAGGLLRRAGAAHRAGRLRGPHRAAGRRHAQRPGARQRRRLGRPVRHARAAPAHPGRRDHRGRQARPPARAGARVRRHRGGHARARCCAGYAGSTGAFQLEPEFSAPYLLGGVDVAVDAVGSKQSLETALHATRAGGRVVLSGMPAAADLSAAWFRELEVVGTYASSRASRGRRPRRLRRRDRARRPRRRGQRWPSPSPATRCTAGARRSTTPTSAGRLGTVKVAFDPRKRG